MSSRSTEIKVHLLVSIIVTSTIFIKCVINLHIDYCSIRDTLAHSAIESFCKGLSSFHKLLCCNVHIVFGYCNLWNIFHLGWSMRWSIHTVILDCIFCQHFHIFEHHELRIFFFLIIDVLEMVLLSVRKRWWG